MIKKIWTKIKNFFKWLWGKIKRFWIWLIFGGIVLAASLTGDIILLTDEISLNKLSDKYAQATVIQQEYEFTEDSPVLIKPAKDINSVKVKLGEKNSQDFEPSMEISRWGNETKFKIKPNLSAIERKDKKLNFENDKIKFGTPKVEYKMYDIDPNEEHPEGAYEYEIILKEKPTSNVVSLNIETKGLEFYYQPELTQKEKAEGAERPENVIGSYAVYYSESGDYSALGGYNYKTGKAFHIYRPKIIDAGENWVWGELNIDTKTGKMTITIDQNFLDAANYPVIVDPTFGYTSAGGSYTQQGTNYFYGSSFLSRNAGIISKITFYGYDVPVLDEYTAKTLIVESPSLEIIEYGISSVTTLSTTASWNDLSYTSIGNFTTISTSSDNSFCYSLGTAVCLSTLNSNIRAGYRDGVNYGDCYDAFRFQDIRVPQGATIESAYFYYEAFDTDASTDNVKIWAEAADDSAAISTTNTDPNSAKNKTAGTESVEWTLPNQTAGTVYTSPDISAVIQEVVDRGGWLSGNSLTILIRNNGATENHNIDNYDGTLDPKLFIQFSSPGARVSPSKNYVLGLLSNKLTNFYYDTGTANQGYTETDNNFNSPTNPSGVSNNTNKYSIYATYACDTPPANVNFGYYKEITVDYTKVATTTAGNYVLLASTTDSSLAATSSGGRIQVVANTGSAANKDYPMDLAFYASDQTTPLPFEIESYSSTTGQIIAWVNLDSLSSTTNTTLYVYYGTSTSPGFQCPSSVWATSTYVSVWHLNWPTSNGSTTYDSTGNNNHGVMTSMAATTSVDGIISGATEFDGINDYVATDLAYNELGSNDITVSLWFKASTGGTELAIGKYQYHAGGNSIFYVQASGGDAVFKLDDNGSTIVNIETAYSAGTGYSVGNWTHFAFVCKRGSTGVAYKNKVAYASYDYNACNAGAIAETAKITLANYSTTYGELVLDEVRIYSAALTLADIQTIYNNEAPTSTPMVTFGSETENGGEPPAPSEANPPVIIMFE